MESNNIVAATGIRDYERVEEDWKGSRFYDGTVDFYSFITTPSPEREIFIRERKMTYDFLGTVVITKI